MKWNPFPVADCACPVYPSPIGLAWAAEAENARMAAAAATVLMKCLRNIVVLLPVMG
jgi:hypothetical protein